MSRKMSGSTNGARDTAADPADRARALADLAGKRKAPKVKTTGSGAPTSSLKTAEEQARPTADVSTEHAGPDKAIRNEVAGNAPGTLAAVAEGYLAAIQRNGRSAGTAASYRADLNVALKFVGADTAVADLTVDRVREFFLDRRVTHTRSGKPKNPVTVAKTRRILRLALCWAAEEGMIPAAPIPTLDAEA